MTLEPNLIKVFKTQYQVSSTIAAAPSCSNCCFWIRTTKQVGFRLPLSTRYNCIFVHRFLAQQVLIKCLDDAANAVKTSDNKMKQKELTRRMGELDHQLNAKHTLIPLSASLLAKGVDGR